MLFVVSSRCPDLDIGILTLTAMPSPLQSKHQRGMPLRGIILGYRDKKDFVSLPNSCPPHGHIGFAGAGMFFDLIASHVL